MWEACDLSSGLRFKGVSSNPSNAMLLPMTLCASFSSFIKGRWPGTLQGLSISDFLYVYRHRIKDYKALLLVQSSSFSISISLKPSAGVEDKFLKRTGFFFYLRPMSPSSFPSFLPVSRVLQPNLWKAVC